MSHYNLCQSKNRANGSVSGQAVVVISEAGPSGAKKNPSFLGNYDDVVSGPAKEGLEGGTRQTHRGGGGHDEHRRGHDLGTNLGESGLEGCVQSGNCFVRAAFGRGIADLGETTKGRGLPIGGWQVLERRRDSTPIKRRCTGDWGTQRSGSSERDDRPVVALGGGEEWVATRLNCRKKRVVDPRRAGSKGADRVS